MDSLISAARLGGVDLSYPRFVVRPREGSARFAEENPVQTSVSVESAAISTAAATVQPEATARATNKGEAVDKSPNTADAP